MLRRCKIGEWKAKQLHHFSSIVFSLYFHWHFLCQACKKLADETLLRTTTNLKLGSLSYKTECDEERTWSKSENQLESVTHSLYLWEWRRMKAKHLGLPKVHDKWNASFYWLLIFKLVSCVSFDVSFNSNHKMLRQRVNQIPIVEHVTGVVTVLGWQSCAVR